MEYRRIGNTNMMASVIGLGGWAIATDKTWGEQDKETSIATIRTALEEGINYFDTAEGYGKKKGESEIILGQALADKRNEALVATKIEVDLEYTPKEEVIRRCESSLRRLNTDYIDIYRIHWPSRITPLVETIDAIDILIQQGKVRSMGISNFGSQDLDDILAFGYVPSNEFIYNLLFRAIEHEIQKKCIDNNISIIAYSPLAQGLLTGKFFSADEVPENRARTRIFSKIRSQTVHGEEGCEAEAFEAIRKIRNISNDIGKPMGAVALAWLLHQPGVTVAIPGARSPEQLRQNTIAASLHLTSDVLEELTKSTEELKRKLGTNPDGWRSESRIC